MIPSNHSDVISALTFGSLTTAAFFQAAITSDPFGAFAQFGLIGLVLGWLMLRVEKRLDEIRKSHDDAKEALNRVGKAIVLLALSGDNPRETRGQAEELLREFDGK